MLPILNCGRILFMNIYFKDLPVGSYTVKTLEEQWGVTKSRGVSDGRCNIVEIDNENVLEITCVKGEVGPENGGVSWRYRLPQTFNELTVEYKVRVSENFDPKRGGKLPGFGGGSNPKGGASTEDADGFSARIMWRELGVLEQYVYSAERSEDKNWGEDYLWSKTQNKNQKITSEMWSSLEQHEEGRVYIIPGEWHKIKTCVKMNTPGKKDGKIITWLDGEEVLNIDLQFREDNSFGIDSLNFACYFGGNDETWAPDKDEQIYFKDFIFE